ncbi:MAG: YicC family protein [Ahniella sp.]|nr:YicC family protein [Ahniella sp.]
MIRSMTAFASAEGTSCRGRVLIEMRSVNHRFLEMGLRCPEDLRALEPKLRERLEKRLSRGKVDISIRVRDGLGEANLSLNKATVRALFTLERELLMLQRETSAGAEPPRSASTFEILNFPGVIAEPEIDQGAFFEEVLAVFNRALADFVDTRQREGERLRTLLIERLDAIQRIVTDVRAWLPDIRTALRTKLETRLAEIKTTVDSSRVEQELVLSLQKIDVDEELDRLESHLVEARSRMDSGEPVGRRLDFLLQEFNRESNTLGSKSVDTRTSQSSVELKVLIEQLREQIQNIE